MALLIWAKWANERWPMSKWVNSQLWSLWRDKNILTGPCMFLYEWMRISWLAPVCVSIRAGNSLIGFLIKLLVFCEKMSKWAIRSTKQAIRSFGHFWWGPGGIRSWLLIYGERPERIAHGRSFLVNELSDSLTSLIFGERPERFAHIANQKWGNERITHFFKQKKLFETN